MYIWHKEARGELSSRQAHERLLALVDHGIPSEPLLRAYAYYKRRAITYGWLDIDFQKAALEVYAETECASVSPPAEPRKRRSA